MQTTKNEQKSMIVHSSSAALFSGDDFSTAEKAKKFEC